MKTCSREEKHVSKQGARKRRSDLFKRWLINNPEYTWIRALERLLAESSLVSVWLGFRLFRNGVLQTFSSTKILLSIFFVSIFVF